MKRAGTRTTKLGELYAPELAGIALAFIWIVIALGNLMVRS